MLDFYIGRIIASAIAIITNLLVVATLGLSFKFWRYNIGTLLLTLACVDVIGNGTFFIFHMTKIFNYHLDFFSELSLNYLNNSFKVLSRLMMILISVNRYALICKPLTHQRFTSRKSVIIQITIVAVISLTASMTCTILYVTGIFTSCIEVTNIITVVIPVVISSVLTFFVIREFRRSHRTLRDSVDTGDTSRQGERNVTKAMVVTNIAFVVLAFPPGLHFFICGLNVELHRSMYSCINHAKITMLFSDINFSINIFIYTLFLPKFRSTLLKMFKCKCWNRRRDESIAMATCSSPID